MDEQRRLVADPPPCQATQQRSAKGEELGRRLVVAALIAAQHQRRRWLEEVPVGDTLSSVDVVGPRWRFIIRLYQPVHSTLSSSANYVSTKNVAARCSCCMWSRSPVY